MKISANINNPIKEHIDTKYTYQKATIISIECVIAGNVYRKNAI